MTRRIGVLGGTFDPIHLAHLAIAEECRDQLGLAEVLFVPAGDPPHKQSREVAPAVQRVAMVELAIASNPRFRLSRVDVDRPGLSYSVDTLRSLRGELGAEADLYFIVGSDSLVDLPNWRDPCRLIELCTIVAVNRPGYPRPDLRQLDARVPGASRRTRVVDVPDLNLTSSEIRQRVSEGRTIRYLVPDPVRAYIAEQQLYRKARGGER
ncbi:MAG TPA: nicotinate-nucleotide adenylyltransferase [Chloroflexota bacterium]|nr:nicotinate-nucleotide adenylyltransferase [Chloroflexota bacterium]